jgi:hypothetical protein
MLSRTKAMNSIQRNNVTNIKMSRRLMASMNYFLITNLEILNCYLNITKLDFGCNL